LIETNIRDKPLRLAGQPGPPAKINAGQNVKTAPVCLGRMPVTRTRAKPFPPAANAARHLSLFLMTRRRRFFSGLEPGRMLHHGKAYRGLFTNDTSVFLGGFRFTAARGWLAKLP
jgi:hypothetical protein